VTRGKIALGAVGSAQLGAGAVGTAYTVRRATTDHAFALGGQFQQLVSWLAGEKVTGGGGYSSDGRITISQSIPFVGSDDQRWGVQLFNGSGEAITTQVNTYVVCASA